MKLLSFIMLTTAPACFAQSGNIEVLNSKMNLKSEISLPAGKQYGASRWKKIWWGEHWRKEWTTPVNFRVFDMDTTAGGVTPIKIGGGHQTKSIRLMGGNGKEYVIRSIDKTLDLLVPEEFKGSFIHEIVNDQISTAHPYAPMVIANLSASIGILHSNPIIVFVPDNKRLGEFRSEFANKLYLFEERPSGDGWENTTLTDFGNKILNTEELLKKLRSDNHSQVDQNEFLKIRLLDMVINDWDRHEDQWVWVNHQKGGKPFYRAFARDRDQAFSKTDGINLFLLSRPWALRNLQNIDHRVRDLIGLNLAATALDRQFLNGLSENDWRVNIASLQTLLSDSIIQQSLGIMPDEIYKLSGDWLNKRLRQRRNDMRRFGLGYYRLLSKEVIIAGTDEKEIFTINKIDKRSTEISVRVVSKKFPAGEISYRRTFFKKDTKTISLYGLRQEDYFIFTGGKKNRILTRIIEREPNNFFWIVRPLEASEKDQRSTSKIL